MAASATSDTTPIESKAQLVAHMETGCKPPSDWRIGTEHEKFAYRQTDLRPLTYDGSPGIGVLLRGLEQFGWDPILEGENVIALKHADGCSVTLEPGGQLELSGALLENIHKTCSEVNTHLDQVRQVCQQIGAGMLGMGFSPLWTRDDMPWMPKGRYKIMRAYMPTKGSMGLDMMLRTCTVQVNLDFSSERDMVRKMRAGVALQPAATALFASSPFVEGKPSRYRSHRSHTWTDTDPDRCGMLPFVFDENFGFERWVDYMLDVPMYFVYRDGQYLDASGKSFRDFMAGKLEGFEGQTPTMGDWQDHMTTVFPEVRLKTFIEMRGADGGPWKRLCALPAFWVGLLYDDQALGEVEALIADWSVAEMAALRDAVPVQALKAPFRDGTVQDLAKRLVEIALGGLERRNRLDWQGSDERQYLKDLRDIAESGRTLADEMVAAYETAWDGDLTKLYELYSY